MEDPLLAGIRGAVPVDQNRAPADFSQLTDRDSMRYPLSYTAMPPILLAEVPGNPGVAPYPEAPAKSLARDTAMDAAGKELAKEPPHGPTPRADVSVRALRTLGEFEACVGLQREVWGRTFSDVVPASLVKIGSEVGGIAAGAFTPDGTLVGFVYGLTGVRDGRLTHWSHMLGVVRTHRGMGIGHRLKCFQRDRLLALGIGEMRWTFDPLVAGNAHFNVSLLGARIERYVPDMYGEMGSDLHAFGTDRVVAFWDLEGSVDARGSGLATASAAAPSLPVFDPETQPPAPGGPSPPSSIRIEIPANVYALGRENPSSAREWRLLTRRSFVAALRSGYEVVGFRRDTGNGTCDYLLRRVPG
jgi:chorismate synthase